ncbi:MAG: CAP domain-containing protein [Anaerolineae bacterium]|jgi:uncharacterized protein YkwD|nr:CAP domain-containing protein [Anaerolineae bacterium]
MIRQLSLIVLTGLIALIGCSPAVPTATNIPSVTGVATPISAHPITDAINQLRTDNAIPVLIESDAINRVIERYAGTIIASEPLDFERLRADLIAEGFYADAISLITYSGADATQVGQALMTSDYRADLLDDQFTHVGVSETDDPQFGTVFVILLTTSASLSAPGANILTPGTPEDQGERIVNLLNMARIQQGLGELRLNPQLTAAAQLHSQDMAAQEAIFHDGTDGSSPSDRAERAGYVGRAIGENVLMRGDINASGAFDQWWNSPPHYENMMSATFDEIGIAYAIGADGNYYYTMLLGTPR